MPPGAKSVARPTRYGNPFVVVQGQGYVQGYWQALSPGPSGIYRTGPERASEAEATADAVDLFRLHCGTFGPFEISGADLDALVGFNLACWCPLDQPCHADILLAWGNP